MFAFFPFATDAEMTVIVIVLVVVSTFDARSWSTQLEVATIKKQCFKGWRYPSDATFLRDNDLINI